VRELTLRIVGWGSVFRVVHLLDRNISLMGSIPCKGARTQEIADSLGIGVNDMDALSEITRIALHEKRIFVKVDVFIVGRYILLQCNIVTTVRVQDKAACMNPR